MSIAPTLQRYLTAENIQYDVIPHDPTMSSAGTAEECRISRDRLAKAIVLRRNAGYMLAVLPASHHLRLSDLRDQLGDNVEMAKESEIDPLFPDCAHGAVPPLGHCYALPLIVDDSIEAQPEIYMEAGDHETLLHLSHAQFARLTANALHGRFSAHDCGIVDICCSAYWSDNPRRPSRSRRGRSCCCLTTHAAIRRLYVCPASKSSSKRKCLMLRPRRRTSFKASIPILICLST